MMNIIAIVMLMSSLGLVMVLSPKPNIFVMSTSNDENVLEAIKMDVQETILNVEEMAESTKDMLVKGMDVVTKPVEKSLGWFRRKPKREDDINDAQEKIGIAKESMQEGGIELKDATTKRLSSTVDNTKEKTTNMYHGIDEKKSQAKEAIENVIEKTQELTKDGIHNVIDTIKVVGNEAYNVVNADKDKAKSRLKKIEIEVEEVVQDAYNVVVQAYESTKDNIYDKVGGTQDTFYDSIGYIKEKSQNIVVGGKDNEFDVSTTIKATTSDAIENAQKKIFNSSERSKDVIIDNVQLRHDEINNIFDDASEKTKTVIEDVASNVKEVGHEIFGKTKDGACETIECLDVRAHGAKSFLSNLGHGVEHIYNHKMINDGDDIDISKEKTTNINENVAQIDKNDKAWTLNGVNNDIKHGQFYDDAKDKGEYDYQGKKDHIEDKYDYANDEIQEYYSKVGQHSKDIRDYYDKSNNYYRDRGGRHYYKRARDVPFRPYFDNTKSKAEDYYNSIKDKERQIVKSVKSKVEGYYDNVRDTTDGYIHDRREEDSKNSYNIIEKKIANGFCNEYDRVEDYCKSSKFKPGKELGAIVESMGWRRIGIVPVNHVLSSSFEEVVIGNVKYAWNHRDQPFSQETLVDRTSNIMKSATHGIDENIDLMKEHFEKDIGNVQNDGVRAKNKIHDIIQANKLPQKRRPWLNRQSNNYQYEDDNSDKNDDFQQSKTSEYVEMNQQQFSRFMKYEKDKESEDIDSWKDVFFKRPEGFLLSLIRASHLLTFSMVYGSSFWMTFVSSIILSKHIPRQQFGYVQSKIFPIYLKSLVVGQSILFVLQFIMHPWFSAVSIERCQLSNFGLMIASTLINAFVFEPQATKIMFEQLKVEKEEGQGLETALSPMDAKQLLEKHKKKLIGINQQFQALHGYSSALNLINLGGLTCHLWHLAHCLVI